MVKKKILILCSANHTSDPRVIRQEKILADFFEIKILSPGKITSKKLRVGLNWRFRQCSLLLRSFILSDNYNYKVFPEAEVIRPQLFLERPTLIICNDLELLGIALEHKRKFGSKLVLDAHEFYPEQSNSFFFRMLYKKHWHKLCSLAKNQTDGMITVCEGIAQKYLKDFEIKNILVIENCSNYVENNVISSVVKKPLRFVHHGIASENRKLELSIEIFEKLGPNYELDLYLVKKSKDYFDSLIQKVDLLDNVRILDPVPFKNIVPTLAAYDCGICFVPGNTINHHYGLPNKFFEFIQARLAVVIGPSIEMEKIVKKYQLGIISEKFTTDSMVKEIQKMNTESVLKYKKASDEAAQFLCAENVWDKLVKMVNQILKN